MRRFALTLLACLLSTLTLASEPNWNLVAVSSDQSLFVLLDTNSVKPRNGQLSAWVKYDYSVGQKTDGYAPKDYLSNMSLETFDCSAERGGTIAINYFSGKDVEGTVVESWTSGSRVVPTNYRAPGSIGLAILESACRTAQSSHPPKSSPRPSPNPTHFIPDQPQLINNRHYTNSDGNEVHSPSNTTTGVAPSNATAQCRDGEFSFSQHRRGTCSGHGGVSLWIKDIES